MRKFKNPFLGEIFARYIYEYEYEYDQCFFPSLVDIDLYYLHIYTCM